MNRKLTNTIRFFMDELIPPVIRDTKWFMYPFYYFAYRGRNLKTVMDFKSKVYTFTEKEYDEFYNNLNTISRNRVTDLNDACINFILDNIDQSSTNIIDIGCGKGHLLSVIKKKHPNINQSGFDIKNPIEDTQSTWDRTYVLLLVHSADPADRRCDRRMDRQTDRHNKGTLGHLVSN